MSAGCDLAYLHSNKKHTLSFALAKLNASKMSFPRDGFSSSQKLHCLPTAGPCRPQTTRHKCIKYTKQAFICPPMARLCKSSAQGQRQIAAASRPGPGRRRPESSAGSSGPPARVVRQLDGPSRPDSSAGAGSSRQPARSRIGPSRPVRWPDSESRQPGSWIDAPAAIEVRVRQPPARVVRRPGAGSARVVRRPCSRIDAPCLLACACRQGAISQLGSHQKLQTLAEKLSQLPPRLLLSWFCLSLLPDMQISFCYL